MWLTNHNFFSPARITCRSHLSAPGDVEGEAEALLAAGSLHVLQEADGSWLVAVQPTGFCWNTLKYKVLFQPFSCHSIRPTLGEGLVEQQPV